MRAAILAANPHNSQPWLFRVGETSIDLFADRDRNLGTIDPYLREMYQGLGCALENLVLAARATGFEPAVTLLPDEDNEAHVARIGLTSTEPEDSPLYEAIPHRHTNRGPYQDRDVPASVLNRLADLNATESGITVRWVTSDAERRTLGDLIVRATDAIVADHDQSDDSAHWYRHDWDELQRHRDGLTVDAQGIGPLTRAVAKILPSNQRENDRFWLDATRDRHTATAAAYGVFVVDDPYDRATQLRAGRLWQRMHLWATAQGVGMHPLNQLPERIDRKRSLGEESALGTELHEFLDADGEVLFLFRLGYPTLEAGPSPRRDASAVSLDG